MPVRFGPASNVLRRGRVIDRAKFPPFGLDCERRYILLSASADLPRTLWTYPRRLVGWLLAVLYRLEQRSIDRQLEAKHRKETR